jgi:putative ABC transport system permease protein
MAILHLTLKSLYNRRGTALLTIAAIAVSVALLLGVQKMRTAARESFGSTVSGVDLIVGARSGQVNLLLFSVFRIGDATANVSWESYQKIARHPDVAWTIPISLGDSHRGYRVLGTNGSYFEHYRYGGSRELTFAQGKPFEDVFDAVLGAEVARALGYKIGDPIVVAHGLGRVSFAEHDDKPFRVAGILAPTGTPVDRTVHVTLEGITAMHEDGHSEARARPTPEAIAARPNFRQSSPQTQQGDRTNAPATAHHDEPHDDHDHAAEEVGAHTATDTSDAHNHADLTPESITAFFVGMRSKVMTFTMQRAINTYKQEALLAILPGVALAELWSLVGVADQALLAIAAFVVLAGLLGMLTAILTSLQERRREMAILRSVGARPRHVFALLVAEAGLLALAGVIAGLALTYGLLFAAGSMIERRFGIFIGVSPPSAGDFAILGTVVLAAVVIGCVPAFRAYRNTLSDGLQIRV